MDGMTEISRSFGSEFDETLTDAKLVKAPADMARLLLAASPRQAAGFALAAHERACWTQCDERTNFWLNVIALLANPNTQGASAAGDRS